MKLPFLRYGLKMAQCIRGGDFNCLSGIYDQVTAVTGKQGEK